MEDFELNIFIDGEKVDLMPINTKHLNLYMKWANNPKVRIYARNVLPTTVQQMKKYLENQKKSERKFIAFEIWLKMSKKPIGEISIFNINWFDRKALIALTIGEPEHWGQGICTEAIKLITDYCFNELNLNKLYAYIYAPNKASYRCFEKSSYKCEATLKQDVYINGEFMDTFLYSILKEDWLKSME